MRALYRKKVKTLNKSRTLTVSTDDLETKSVANKKELGQTFKSNCAFAKKTTPSNVNRLRPEVKASVETVAAESPNVPTTIGAVGAGTNPKG
jgi:hypothetical protein